MIMARVMSLPVYSVNNDAVFRAVGRVVEPCGKRRLIRFDHFEVNFVVLVLFIGRAQPVAEASVKIADWTDGHVAYREA